MRRAVSATKQWMETNMTTLWIDLETFCDVPITHGVHKYAERAEILLFAYALDAAPVQVWDCTAQPDMPVDLDTALRDESVTLVCHNVAFDRTILRHVLPHFYLPVPRWRDTMVRALAHSLPGSLGQLCEIFRIPTDKAKDKEGRQLVLKFCKPQGATSKIARSTRETHPAEWARFVEYARLDVEAMRALDAKLPRYNDSAAERALWQLDQVINDRGVAVDLDLARAAIAAVEREQKALAKRTQELTGDAVQAATQRDAMLAHILETYGVKLPDMQQSTLQRRIDDPDLPAPLRELLAVRLAASTTSVAKYKTLVNATSSDGRLRGTLQFCGASRTGRWAGRLVQLQNLARPTLPQDEIDQGVEDIKLGCADLLHENVMQLSSSAVRGCIVAPPGKKLVVADLANIEGRVLAWLAGEQWKLKAFRDFDRGRGEDLYKLAYARAFNVPVDSVNKDQRQIGKVMELMLGYEGGVGAFITGAATYGIDLDAMADAALPSIPADVRAEAKGLYSWRMDNSMGAFGLTPRAFIACDSLKRAWRLAHPATVQFWEWLGTHAIDAVQLPDRGYLRRAITVRRDKAWLLIKLPSGRYLCYPSPRIEDGKITYMGVNPYTRKWERLATYGGKLVENVTQAVARDVLACAMPRVETVGYEIVLSVHDELITEAPDNEDYSADALADLMTEGTPWTKGLPLAAAGFETRRYYKG